MPLCLDLPLCPDKVSYLREPEEEDSSVPGCLLPKVPWQPAMSCGMMRNQGGVRRWLQISSTGCGAAVLELPVLGLVGREGSGAPGCPVAVKHSYCEWLLLSWWVIVLLGNGLSGDTVNSQHGAVILPRISDINHIHGAG